MLDFLSSPVLFPSDINSPKLSAEATFKLPEMMNWADYDYYNTMKDKSMTNLTDLIKLEPVYENYTPLLLDDDDVNKLSKVIYHEKMTTTGGIDNDDSKRMALLGLAQSMVQAYSFPFYCTPIISDDDDDEQRNVLRANLRGALDVVEYDMQQNGYDSLYSSKKQQHGIERNSFLFNHFIDGQQWSWREEMVDVPDLVHSPSTQSLAINYQPPTPVLLESGISSYMENDNPDQQQQKVSKPLPTSTSIKSIIQQPQYIDDMKKSPPLKKWMNKMKKATSTVKQDCIKSISSTSHKLCQWIKK